MKNGFVRIFSGEMKYLVAVILVLGCMIFSQKSFAQSASFTAQGATTVKTTSGNPINYDDVVGSNEAVLILKAAVRNLEAQNPTNTGAQLKKAIQVEYYSFLLKQLSRGALLENLLPGSYTYLKELCAQTKPSYTFKAADLMEETVLMLSL